MNLLEAIQESLDITKCYVIVSHLDNVKMTIDFTAYTDLDYKSEAMEIMEKNKMKISLYKVSIEYRNISELQKQSK